MLCGVQEVNAGRDHLTFAAVWADMCGLGLGQECAAAVPGAVMLARCVVRRWRPCVYGPVATFWKHCNDWDLLHAMGLALSDEGVKRAEMHVASNPALS